MWGAYAPTTLTIPVIDELLQPECTRGKARRGPAPLTKVEEAALLVLCVPARGRRRARGRGLALFFFVHDALPIEAQDFPEALQAHQQLALVIW